MYRLLLFSAVLVPVAAIGAPRPAAPPSQPVAEISRKCINARARWTGPQRAEARRLGELPSGDLYSAVVREVDGCQEPVVIRYGYGGTGPKR
jgi:hypothetical protein